jgi:hypothetical protein
MPAVKAKALVVSLAFTALVSCGRSSHQQLRLVPVRTISGYTFLVGRQGASLCYALVKSEARSAVSTTSGLDDSCTDSPAPALTVATPITIGHEVLYTGVVNSEVENVVFVVNGQRIVSAVTKNSFAYLGALPTQIGAVARDGSVLATVSPPPLGPAHIATASRPPHSLLASTPDPN